jgi:DNA-binding transcriptional MerR regulator
VGLWTTRYIDAAVAQLRAEGHEIRDEDIARLSPLKHKYRNVLGRYSRSILALRDGGQAPCGHVTRRINEHLAEIKRRLAELAKTRDALHGLARRAAETDPDTCVADDICTILVPAGDRSSAAK